MSSSFIASISESVIKGQVFTPRWGLSAALLNGKVYIFGGYLWFHGVEGFFNDLYELDISSNSIRRIFTDVSPSSRFGHTLVADSVHNCLLLFGGRDSHESCGDVWAFDVLKQKWQLIHQNHASNGVSPNSSNSSRATSVAGTSLASTSASGGSSPTTASSKNINSNEHHSGGGSSGKNGGYSGGTYMTHQSSTSIGEEANVVLTTSRKGERRSKRIDGGNKESNPDSKASSVKGESIPNAPLPRSWHTASVYRQGVYVYGGWDHHNRVFNDLWMFDLSSHVWLRIDPPEAINKPPYGRSCHQAVVWGDAMYIFGGLRDGDAAIGDMWKFSFDLGVWSPVDCLGYKPAGRTSAAGVLVGDSWVIHGGLTDYPRNGMAAIADIIEFNFVTSTWVNRGVVVSDNNAPSSHRYGHVSLSSPIFQSILLLGGAERYATACQTSSCRLDLIPSQSQVIDISHDLIGLHRLSQMTRDRVEELFESAAPYESQIRQLKTDNLTLVERCQTLQSQMSSLHQQHSALQASFQSLQQSLAAVEQFIPMMRTVGAAIANFGNVGGGGGGWTTPNSSGSVGGSLGVQSNSQLGLGRSGER